jgi:hypothetical protein
MSDDPDADGYEIRSPNHQDRLFHEHLRDEFWLVGGDYYLFIMNENLCNNLCKN